MAGYENIKDKGFDKRSTGELREISSRGGKSSGEVRRRKAALRDTMNRLLTMRAEVEGLSDILRADGGESTYEELISMVMIEKAMKGDVRAYNAIKATVGQTDKSEMDLEEQNARIKVMKSKNLLDGEEEMEDDGFLNALNGTAAEDWEDEE